MKKIFVIPLIFIFSIYGIATFFLVYGFSEALFIGVQPKTIPRIIFCVMVILGMILFMVQETRSFHYYSAICAVGFILYFIAIWIYTDIVEPEDLVGWKSLDWTELYVCLLFGIFGSLLMLIGSCLGWYFQRLYKRTKDSSGFR